MGRLVRVVITLAVVVAVLVAIDWGAAVVAQNLVADQVKKDLSLKKDPSVDIHGFPFLTQAIGGKYDHITVTAHSVDAVGELRIATLRAELYGVKASVGDIVDDKADKIKVGSVDGTATIGQSTVAALLNVPSLKIAPVGGTKPVGPSAHAKLTGRLGVAGQSADVTVDATIKVAGGDVHVIPKRATVGGKPVPDLVKGTVLNAFSTSLTPGTLPYGLRPTGVAIRKGAVLLSGHAEHVKVAA